MRRNMIVAMVLMGCLLMAIPAMATTVGAQTADDESFAFDATLDTETVTVSVTSNDTVLENATVVVNGTEEGTTDANGTLQFGLDNRSALKIGITVDNTTQSTTYAVVDGSLVEQTESTDEPTEFAFDATLDDGTVTVSVTSNDTVLENATVAVNGTEEGTTDANGTLQFDLNDRPAVEIAVTVDGTTQSTTYEVVGGELITQASADDAQVVPEAAADQVSTIQRLTSAFRNGEFEKLGPIVSEAAGGGPPDDVGNPPEDAGQGNAPEDAGQGNAPENVGQGNAPEDAGSGQDNASEDGGNGQEDGGSDRGNSGGNGGGPR